MTRSQEQTLISVRGRADRVVPADQASVQAELRAVADTKAAATATVNLALCELLAELGALAGQPLTADNHRAPLTWSAQSIRTDEEYGQDPNTGTHGKTGRQVSSITLLVAVRDFGLLGRLEAALTDREPVDIQMITWSVDEDNPAWALVRADAIRAALLKGQDYAAALGGTIIGVQHVADSGLLGSGADVPIVHAFATRTSGRLAEASATLDPVPQQLTATIDARLTATIGPLPSR